MFAVTEHIPGFGVENISSSFPIGTDVLHVDVIAITELFSHVW